MNSYLQEKEFHGGSLGILIVIIYNIILLTVHHL